FDALWIAGLDAGAWPRPAQANPFLPVAVQRSANMPGSSAAREFAHAQRVMARLVGSSAEGGCSYPAHAASGDKSEQQQARPLIAGYPRIAHERADENSPMFRVFSHAPVLEARPVDEGLALAEGTEQSGGSKVLANQSACPFRAFAVHRLKATEVDEPDVGLS